jgi:hypothetical protein
VATRECHKREYDNIVAGQVWGDGYATRTVRAASHLTVTYDYSDRDGRSDTLTKPVEVFKRGLLLNQARLANDNA